MSFVQQFPNMAALLGAKSVKMLDDHAAALAGATDDAAVAHFKGCELSNICSLYNGGWGHPDDRLELIEWGLSEVLKSQVAAKIRTTFGSKLNDDGEFYQLLGELAVALTAQLHGMLLDLEWKTGVKKSKTAKEKDADVRAEFVLPVNLEVTIRTDPLMKAAKFHLEDFVDDEGKPILGKRPTAVTRNILTKEEKEDYAKKGIAVPELRNQAVELQPEPKEIADRITTKAGKFNPDGLHVVVLATSHTGMPPSNTRYAVFGSSELVANGIFCNDQCRQIAGVIYLDVFSHLWRLCRQAQGQQPVHKRNNRLFLNPHAAVPLPEAVWNRLSTAFEAEIEQPHGKSKIIVPKK